MPSGTLKTSPRLLTVTERIVSTAINFSSDGFSAEAMIYSFRKFSARIHCI